MKQRSNRRGDSEELHWGLLMIGLLLFAFGGGHGAGTALILVFVAAQQLFELKLHLSPEIGLIVLLELAVIGLMIASRFVRDRDFPLVMVLVAMSTAVMVMVVLAINETSPLVPLVSGIPLFASIAVAIRRAITRNSM
ncbi:MAG: hypothetical protein K2Y21_05365 [Phycisphaerales bacterium]|nr:hypothetical protein [Phycisphaerales bacterium]